MSRWAGAAVAGTLTFALLVGGCVFTALAGPAGPAVGRFAR